MQVDEYKIQKPSEQEKSPANEENENKDYVDSEDERGSKVLLDRMVSNFAVEIFYPYKTLCKYDLIIFFWQFFRDGSRLSYPSNDPTEPEVYYF